MRDARGARGGGDRRCPTSGSARSRPRAWSSTSAPGPTSTTIVAFLRSRDLATYKLPQQVRIVPELPTTPSGKVRKNELRELILGGTP